MRETDRLQQCEYVGPMDHLKIYLDPLTGTTFSVRPGEHVADGLRRVDRRFKGGSIMKSLLVAACVLFASVAEAVTITEGSLSNNARTDINLSLKGDGFSYQRFEPDTGIQHAPGPGTFAADRALPFTFTIPGTFLDGSLRNPAYAQIGDVRSQVTGGELKFMGAFSTPNAGTETTAPFVFAGNLQTLESGTIALDGKGTINSRFRLEPTGYRIVAQTFTFHDLDTEVFPPTPSTPTGQGPAASPTLGGSDLLPPGQVAGGFLPGSSPIGAVVPEPSTLILLGTGLVIVGLYRRRTAVVVVALFVFLPLSAHAQFANTICTPFGNSTVCNYIPAPSTPSPSYSFQPQSPSMGSQQDFLPYGYRPPAGGCGSLPFVNQQYKCLDKMGR